VRATLKARRRRVVARDKAARRRRRHQLEHALGADAPPRAQPRTIEDSREYDDDTGRPLTAEQARAVRDEFTATLAGERKPNVLLTTAVRPGIPSYDFVRAVLPVLPTSVYYERRQTSIAELTQYAAGRGFTDVLIIKEDKKKLSSLVHAHLPTGPTAVYKISSFVPSKQIRGHGRSTRHMPEVLLNNFSTDLGLRVGRMLGALFPHTPNFVGRQAATFHNQRDFIFFRFHRYVFNAGRDKARLQELGPRFTLKLQGLQKGTFKDPQLAEHEWKNSTKKDVERRKFFL
jgi:ribosome production factor 1